MELSCFVTYKAKMMGNAFKGVFRAKLHWYRFILLFRMNLYLFACIFCYIFMFNLIQG